MSMKTAKKSSADRTKVARAKDPQRSRITNGSALLPGIDGRSAWVRRAKDLLTLHISDLGGEDNVSEAERALLRRAVTLIIELERREVMSRRQVPPPTMRLRFTRPRSTPCGGRWRRSACSAARAMSARRSVRSCVMGSVTYERRNHLARPMDRGTPAVRWGRWNPSVSCRRDTRGCRARRY
jgi:hypothetical protein